jgi:SulP family sulfate permease
LSKHSRVADNRLLCFLAGVEPCRAGKTLHLRHLSPDCRQLLHNVGALVGVNVEEDPLYTVVGERAG